MGEKWEKPLRDLTEGLAYVLERGTLDRLVSSIVHDTRLVTPGSLFVCIQGARFDSHEAAGQVALAGAAVLVTQRSVSVPEDLDVTILRVPDTRYAMACIAAAWYGHPAKRLKTIGITGTKGKTTTSYLVKSILEQAGYRVGLIGTIEVIIGDRHLHTDNTTPESCLIQEYFHEMVLEGMDAVVMEVSSQSLMQQRTQGFEFDYGVFTNIEPDHIGPNEHRDFNDYLSCKSLLFRQCRVGIFNLDDAHWRAVAEGHTCRIETFGFSPKADLIASDVSLFADGGRLGASFSVNGSLSLRAKIGMPGKFSVYNALAAIAVCRHFDVSARDIQAALPLAQVKGRIETVPVSDEFTVLIDYAHNAMAMESLYVTLREYHPHRLISVFGCGGNRARQRRFEMGEVSGRLADLTIITSDNPRYEEPLDIMADIRKGIAGTGGDYLEICDRKEAIAYAIRHGEPGDIIVLAGKGHEDYQEIKGVKYPLDERDLISQVLGELANEAS